MKKFIRFLIIIVILAALLFAAYRYFLSGKSSFQSVYLVPPDAIMILESDAAFSAWDKIINSQAWNSLKTNEALAGLNTDMESIDSLFTHKRLLLKLIGRRKVMMSMHAYQPGKYDYLYIINIGKLTRLRNPEKLLSSVLGRDYRITKRMYNTHTIYELLDSESGEMYVFSFLKEKAIFSTNYMLVEESIDEESNMTLGRNFDFIAVSKKISGKGLFNVYLNYSYFTDYLKKEAGITADMINDLDRELIFSGFSFNITPEGMISLEGFTAVNDTVPSFFTSVLNAGEGTLQSGSVIPARIASMVKISLDDIRTYYMLSLDQMGKKEKESFISNQQKLEKKLKISVEKNFLSWMDDEIILLQTQPSNLGRKNEFAAIMPGKNKKDPEENLYFIGRQIERNTPIKIKEVDYQGYTISYISLPGILKALFGKMLDKIEKPYYTQIDRFVIFSNHPQTIKNIIDDYLAGNTLENSLEYSGFSNNFSRKNTVFTYLDLPVMYSNLEAFVDKETWGKLKKNKPYILSFPQAGIQIDSEDNILHLLLKAQYSEHVEEFTPSYFDPVNILKMFTYSEQQPAAVPQWYAPKIIIQDLDDSQVEENFENGELKFSAGMKNGLLHGNYREYYPNGNLKVKGKYKNDKQEGDWKLYDEEGNLLEEKEFSEGTEVTE